MGFPDGSMVKKPPANVGAVGDCGLNPWVGKILWRRKWQPISVFLPGESHGRRSLVGYSPRGHKELDMTERLHFHFHFIAYKASALVCMLSCFSCAQLFVTLWTIAHQASLSMGFSRQDTGVGCHVLPQGIFLTQGLNLTLVSSISCIGRQML